MVLPVIGWKLDAEAGLPKTDSTASPVAESAPVFSTNVGKATYLLGGLCYGRCRRLGEYRQRGGFRRRRKFLAGLTRLRRYLFHPGVGKKSLRLVVRHLELISREDFTHRRLSERHRGDTYITQLHAPNASCMISLYVLWMYSIISSITRRLNGFGFVPG